MIHLLFHFILPVLIAFIFFRKNWLKVSLIFWATMLVDVDHLLATPIYEPMRCSINFHPLHSYWMIAFYVLCLIPKKTRLVSIGLLLHMLLDWQDCYYKI